MGVLFLLQRMKNIVYYITQTKEDITTCQLKLQLTALEELAV